MTPPLLLTKSKRLHVTFSIILFFSLAIIYGQVTDHAFINFDDDSYIYKNVRVQEGINLEGVVWAFTTTHAGNWHPITWLSHMLSCQFFGLDAGWHHRVSVLLHAFNALLLFSFLFTTTSRFYPSAFVGLLFAIHPLHVESVCWASEQKDLLSTFFMLLTILSYSSHSKL